MTENCPLCHQPLLTDAREKVFLDLESNIALVCGIPVGLTRMEMGLLEALHRRAPALVSVPAIHDRLYGLRGESANEHGDVSVLVCKIRKKLKGTRARIVSIWGQGFKLEVDDELLA